MTDVPPDIIVDDRMPELQALSDRIARRQAELAAQGMAPAAIYDRVREEFGPPDDPPSPTR